MIVTESVLTDLESLAERSSDHHPVLNLIGGAALGVNTLGWSHFFEDAPHFDFRVWITESLNFGEAGLKCLERRKGKPWLQLLGVGSGCVHCEHQRLPLYNYTYNYERNYSP